MVRPVIEPPIPSIPPPVLPQDPIEDGFSTISKKFEAELKQLTYHKCGSCLRVKLGMHMSNVSEQPTCFTCHSKRLTTDHFSHPLWVDEFGVKQFHVPSVLQDLTDGERLLIQQVSPYVPLRHLHNGSYGCKGHVSSFPQDISDICTRLPRLHENVTTLSVVKSFISEDNEPQKLSFRIRREKILSALRWLKRYNVEYKNIDIVEDNLNWMTESAEDLPSLNMDLPMSEENSNTNVRLREKEAYEDQTPTDASIYGYLQTPATHNTPQVKDTPVTNVLRESVLRVNKNTSIDFPYVSEVPMDEYDSTIKLFCKAFPWLYPGGVGDYNDYTNTPEDIDTWMERQLYYFDGRFARDKMWCFFLR